ncbi:hypothetical protein [Catellatospora coxensis]|uniref:DUF4034 domain-containing protein n=1 Tax=Catellatospora coxensis TaxID=310354 RepID=A0A8J3L0W1_9ACTN|nr:hypothetical protein [Catellatospora coxensis]GIG10430.1 hypothetical protein Cco03nite_71300 [Catellatospora coxensis]
MPLPNLSALLGKSSHHDRVHHYPDLAPLRAALRAKDWPAVVAYFERLPEHNDPTVATYLVAETRGVEKFLRTAGGGPASSTLAGSLLGARLVIMAWDARGAGRADVTSDRQFREFHKILLEAEQVLGDVTAENPGDVAAWTSRLKTARGLSMGLDEANRRYERAAKARANPVAAQSNHLQQLCPKWGGSLERLHAFARACADNAPAGSLNAAVVAEAHLEHAYHEGNLHYLRQPPVLAEIQDAVARSVGHPDHRPVHGWVQAEACFAFVLWHAGDYAGAAERMAALGDRVTDSYPWFDKDEFASVRRILRGMGGAR